MGLAGRIPSIHHHHGAGWALTLDPPSPWSWLGAYFALIVASIGKGEMSVGQVKQPNWFRQPDFYAQFCEFHDAVLTEFLFRFRDNRIHSGRYVPI